MYKTSDICSGKTWAEREENILKVCKPLVIKDFSLTEYDDNLEDFVHNYLARYNSLHMTVEVGNMETQQCSPKRLRSLIDLFLICKHYFPECTLEEVKNALYANDHSSQVCSTVHRRVYWIHLNTRGIVHQPINRDEFGLIITNYKKEEE